MKKKNILFIVDLPNWAFDNMVRAMIPALQAYYNVYIDYSYLFRIRKIEKVSFRIFLQQNIKSALRLIFSFFFRNNISPLGFISKSRTVIRYYTPSWLKQVADESFLFQREVKPYSFSYDAIFEMDYFYQYASMLPYKAKKKAVGIYTEGFPHNGINYDFKRRREVDTLSIESFFNEYIRHYDCLVVGSKGLEDQYDKFGKKTFFLNAVFKENAFKVWTDASKFFNKQLVIGWTGNPKRGFKGFEDIILPAIKLVKDSGRDIVLKTQFSGTYDSLIDFYTDVALVVIASEADTGPFMFSEASLSGIPAISTKVGFPRMVIQDGKNGIIVKERTVRYFVESICKLFDDRELLFSMAERIRGDYLKILGNDVLVDNWKNAIEFMIHNPRPK